MAEILSREKELFKINQELNLMSLNPAEELAGISQSRYGTYLKQKGPSTLLKKKFNGETVARSSGARRTVKSRSPNKSAATTPSTNTPSPQVSTPRGKLTPTQLMSQLTKSTKLNERKQGKAQSSQQASRLDSSLTRKACHKTATYVKYRNPNFTQSPSLDMLLRQEDEELEQQVLEVEVTKQTRESTTVINGGSKKQLTQDNFIRFLKAKVAILEEDHGQLTQDMAVQRERLEEAAEALRKAESQRDQAITTNSKLSDQLQRLEQQHEEANRRQKERQLEFTNQQRDLELLKRDAKMLKQANTNLENRLARANDEAESARQLLNKHNTQQKEDQESNRKDLKLRDNRIKALKRQRADLLNAYKKQLFMIDNLKRQNTCVEQAVAVGFGEKEFNKVLEWNTAGGSKTVF